MLKKTSSILPSPLTPPPPVPGDRKENFSRNKAFSQYDMPKQKNPYPGSHEMYNLDILIISTIYLVICATKPRLVEFLAFGN